LQRAARASHAGNLLCVSQQAEGKAGNRAGGPLEFLGLLGGLTKRW
jgi:hypothetical protein